LPEQAIQAGIQQLHTVLAIILTQARALPSQFDNAEPFEDLGHCTSLLHLRMEVWAAFVTLDDAYDRLNIQGTECRQDLNVKLDQILTAIETLDDLLQEEQYLELLSIVTSLPLLRNWKLMLAESYRTDLPWWLNGTLEEAAARIERSILRDEYCNLGWRHLQQRRPQPRSFVFRRHDTGLSPHGETVSLPEQWQLAAALRQSIRLESDEQHVLWLVPHPNEQLRTLRLIPPIATHSSTVFIDHKPVALVEPWNADGQAIIQTSAIQPVVEDGAELELRTD
jgi:hypothetical protein